MEQGTFRKKVSNFLGYKKLNSYQFEEIYKLLSEIKNDENMKSYYYNFMGKVLLKQGKYQEAKYYFLEHIFNFPDFVSCYYYLYKIDVYEQNFIDAYLDLFKYKESSNIEKLDITFPLSMLEICLDLQHNPNNFLNSDYSINNNYKYFYFEFKEEETKKLYNEIIEYFNNCDYHMVHSKLIELNDIVIKDNLSIDLSPMIMMINFIIKSLEDIYKINLNKILEKESIDSSDKDFLKMGIESKYIKKQKAFSYVDKLIDKNIQFAKQIISKIENDYLLDDNTDIYNYFKFKIDEKITYLDLSDSNKDIYNQCIKNGKKAYKSNDLGKALSYYEEGKAITNHPVFDYYIGKILFKKGNYKEAVTYLTEYQEHGGSKLLQCLLYLSIICCRKGNRKSAIKYLKKLKKISSYLGEEWKINLLEDKEDDREKDRVKERVSKSIKISQNIFHNKPLDINNYYNYSAYEKLQIIKQLYQSNRIKQADTLMKELDKNIDDKNFRKALNSEKRNRTLYINQSKRA